MGSFQPQLFDVKKIAVIGAGPGGLAAAKYLTAQGAFESVVLFEQQSEVGGVWNYGPVVPPSNPIPQTDPFFPADRPVQMPGHGGFIFPSTMYKKMHANLPKMLMNFSDLEFGEDSWLYPQREKIQEYLVKYATDLRHLIRFNTSVESVALHQQDGVDKWHVQVRSIIDGEISSAVFDAVVVANGHYATPFVPQMKNIGEFHATHPSVIIHSKSYQAPEDFKDKKVVIVGNGPSGQDIAFQINNVSKGQSLLSVRTPTDPAKLAHTGCEEVGEIEEFLVDERGVRFKGGRVETDVDAVLFCTGFLYSFPFLNDLQRKLITNGKGVHGLYKHIFCIAHPTLVFATLNIKAVPFPLSESQAAVVSAVWSNNLPLPSREEMERWSKDLDEATPKGALHVVPFPKDAEYINEMHDWSQQAARKGKKPPRWGPYQFWQRKVIFDAKMQFEKQNCEAETLDELGFVYDSGAV